VDVKVARELTSELALKIQRQSDKICKAFNIRDMARIDYRLNSAGELYFLEINALPSLQEGAAILISAAKHGYKTIAEVLEEVVCEV
jgi:D-alanine-D-alanine ligase